MTLGVCHNRCVSDPQTQVGKSGIDLDGTTKQTGSKKHCSVFSLNDSIEK